MAVNRPTDKGEKENPRRRVTCSDSGVYGLAIVDKAPSPAAKRRDLSPRRGEVVLALLKSATDRKAKEKHQQNLAPFRGEVAAKRRVRGNT